MRQIETGQRSRQGGLSLVELLVSIAIGLFLLAVVGYLYIGSRQSYRMQDNMARVQENGRMATEVLSRGIRIAGYTGCGGPSANFRNTLNAQSTAANSQAWDFTRNSIEGFEATGTNTWSTVSSGTSGVAVSATDIDANIQSGSDAITIRAADNMGVRIVGQPSDNVCSGTSADLKVTNNTELSDGMVVMAADASCGNSTVFQITQFNGNENVVHNTGVGSPGNSTKDMGACFHNGRLYTVAAKSFYIRSNALYMKEHKKDSAGNWLAPVELVGNVENMQITYGIDNNPTAGDGAIDQYVAANAVTNWSQVKSVRIRLLLVSPDNGITNQAQTYMWDTDSDGDLDAVTATDNRLRYVYSTTIGVRNRLP